MLIQSHAKAALLPDKIGSLFSIASLQTDLEVSFQTVKRWVEYLFENLVASHLLKTCHYWTDSGEGDFELFYLRDKEKREIDFLITKDRKPWLPVEAKLSDHEPSPHWRKFLREIPCHKALQIIREPGHWRIHPAETKQILVASANEALSYFI